MHLEPFDAGLQYFEIAHQGDIPRAAQAFFVCSWASCWAAASAVFCVWKTASTKPLKGDKTNKIDTMEQLVALYREFEGTGKFPTKRMVPMRLTLGEWLHEIDKGGR